MNLISNEFFPYTTLENVVSYFDNQKLQNNIVKTIKNSKDIIIYNTEGSKNNILICKTWSVIKKIKCILYHSNKPIYWDEILWTLRDFGIEEDKIDKYKLNQDKRIKFEGRKYSYLHLDAEEVTKDTLDQIYNRLLELESTISIKEIHKFITISEDSDLTEEELFFLLSNDERFIIIDNQIVMVKT